MARNRQRAKERKQKRRGDPVDAESPQDGRDDVAPGPGDAPDPELGQSRALVPDSDELAERDDESESSAAGGDGGDRDGGDPPVALAGAGGSAPAKKQAAIPRFVAFLRHCWAELQRVQWPDRRQVGQATAVVLGFVVIAGAFLGLADVVSQEIVDAII